MAYSEEIDFQKRIKQADLDKLTAVTEDETITPKDILDEAIETADSTIDSYLQNSIANLPLDTPPPSIVQASCDIAIYNLHSRIQYIDIPEWVNSRYQAVMKWLLDISKGLASINVSSLADDETISGGVQYGTERNIFDSQTF